MKFTEFTEGDNKKTTDETIVNENPNLVGNTAKVIPFDVQIAANDNVRLKPANIDKAPNVNDIRNQLKVIDGGLDDAGRKQLQNTIKQNKSLWNRLGGWGAKTAGRHAGATVASTVTGPVAPAVALVANLALLGYDVYTLGDTIWDWANDKKDIDLKKADSKNATGDAPFTAPPRPTSQGGRNKLQDRWDKMYGKTHNPDGSPIVVTPPPGSVGPANVADPQGDPLKGGPLPTGPGGDQALPTTRLKTGPGPKVQTDLDILPPGDINYTDEIDITTNPWEPPPKIKQPGELEPPKKPGEEPITPSITPTPGPNFDPTPIQPPEIRPIEDPVVIPKPVDKPKTIKKPELKKPPVGKIITTPNFGPAPRPNLNRGKTPPGRRTTPPRRRAFGGLALPDKGDPKYRLNPFTPLTMPDPMNLSRYKSFGEGVAEREMTKKEKAKEKRLKKKYDDSDMKASMKKQYGKDWKTVYYATIRKQAMEQANEGYQILPSIDKARYDEIQGMEGPMMTASGKVLYYDPQEGAYYDRDSDMYLSYEEFKQYDEPIRADEGENPFANNPLYKKAMWPDDDRNERKTKVPDYSKMIQNISPKGAEKMKLPEPDYSISYPSPEEILRQKRIGDGGTPPPTKKPTSKKSTYMKPIISPRDIPNFGTILTNAMERMNEAPGDEELLKPMIDMDPKVLPIYAKNIIKKFPHLKSTVNAMIGKQESVATEGRKKNKMGPQEIMPGDRVEHEGEKFEVVDVSHDPDAPGTIIADNLVTGLRNRLHIDKVTKLFGMDAMTDQDKEELEAMFKRLKKAGSGSLKHVATEGEAGDHERMYKVVHAKKGMMDIKAKTSYEAAKKFAKEKGLKSTAGVDTHLYPLEEGVAKFYDEYDTPVNIEVTDDKLLYNGKDIKMYNWSIAQSMLTPQMYKNAKSWDDVHAYLKSADDKGQLHQAIRATFETNPENITTEASSPWTSSGKHPEDMNREELEHEIDIFKQYKKMGMSLSPQEIMRMDSLYDYLDTVDEECRYCGGDCPNDEENACDGYLGDIDNLYGTRTDENLNEGYEGEISAILQALDIEHHWSYGRLHVNKRDVDDVKDRLADTDMEMPRISIYEDSIGFSDVKDKWDEVPGYAKTLAGGGAVAGTAIGIDRLAKKYGPAVVDKTKTAISNKYSNIKNKLKRTPKPKSNVLNFPSKNQQKLGKLAKFGKGVLGKAAWPLALGLAGYDAVRGYRADPNASFTQKMKNAGNTALDGISFGTLGRDATMTKPNKPPSVKETLEQHGFTLQDLQEKVDQYILVKENVDTMRKIVANKSAMPVKFEDGTMKVDMTTASIFLQAFDKMRDDNQAKVAEMLRTKKGFLRVMDIIYGAMK